ncbi:baseplate J/gp47 family protein [Maridesulfovibrio ferrireducens]|uniref:baseplate assembly protein n=1 Tax=Maridesulfovibrio ferrireducens TaxID=246191 RepID=UPI001A2EBC1F|nr:baseplate J/gp47 family protein [Maridesulfovibrio ferrireducens]MBI9112240.1 baseplate J/gp47 family protein [Maridesulfovibrio ferrireducens]
MNLDNLPNISFCETDGSNVEQEVITGYEKIAGVTLAAGDPVRLYLESLAYILTVQRQVIDLTGKKNLLAYARGDHLDHLGALTDTPRLQAYFASTAVRFELGEVQTSAVVIPAGTRITPDNQLMFATDDLAEIPAGSLSIDAIATCQTEGTIGNGFIPDQINRLVDPVAGVTKAHNISTTLGGAEIEADDRYRERVQLSPEKASVAGPSGKYEYWAKSAHTDIADIAVLSPTPGKVDIIVLLKNGELPNAEILNAVEAVVSPEDVRPLTDNTEVLAAETVEYTIELSWFIGRSNATLAASIQDKVNQAITDFMLWQRSALGRDINPTELAHQMRQAGAKRVEITSPVHTPLTGRQVAILAHDGLLVTYGGLEDD